MENRDLKIVPIGSSDKPAKVNINVTLNKGDDKVSVQIEANHASMRDMLSAQEAINDAFDDMFKETIKLENNKKQS